MTHWHKSYWGRPRVYSRSWQKRVTGFFTFLQVFAFQVSGPFFQKANFFGHGFQTNICACVFHVRVVCMALAYRLWRALRCRAGMLFHDVPWCPSNAFGIRCPSNVMEQPRAHPRKTRSRARGGRRVVQNGVTAQIPLQTLRFMAVKKRHSAPLRHNCTHSRMSRSRAWQCGIQLSVWHILVSPLCSLNTATCVMRLVSNRALTRNALPV